MQRPVILFPHRHILLADFEDASLSRQYIAQGADARLGVSSLIEAFRRRTARVI